MVDTKTLGLAEATALADDDAVMVVDISDTTMDPTGTNKFMEKLNLLATLGIDELTVFAGNSISTGIQNGGVITLNADTSKFDISLGAGLVVDSHTDPSDPAVVQVTWSAFTAELHLASVFTAVGIQKGTGGDPTAGEVVTQNTAFTQEQRRDIISLAVVVHTGGAVGSIRA